MKTNTKRLLLPLLSLSLATAQADTFGSGAFSINFTNVGNAINTADSNTFGSVGYNYRMGVNEVSRGMIDTYNSLSGGPTLTLADMSSFGGNGADRPATGISWNEAARFVNWLNTSEGYSAAYKFTTSGFNDNIALWESGDSGYDAANPYRNANAHYFLPSRNEWYKAAYYDPAANSGLGGYWDYATGSNSAPGAVASGTASGTAVFDQLFNTGPADITQAGGLSPYGTMAQGGNVVEWAESAFIGLNDAGNKNRVYNLGGKWNQLSGNLVASSGNIAPPTYDNFDMGFRVAANVSAVPEPSAFLMTLLGMAGLMVRRKR